MNDEMPPAPAIDTVLIVRLLKSQFPQWAKLKITPVIDGGWDNRTFRIGRHMLARLPSAACYEPQVEKEHRWLPILAPLLPCKIPNPLAVGAPGAGYSWKWSIYGWLDGTPAASAPIGGSCSFALDVADFLRALHGIDTSGGPVPGPHNFYRGGFLATYDGEMREAVDRLKGRVDGDAAIRLWNCALTTSWAGDSWVHGDVSGGNLLVQHGRLCGVIDFGMLGVGDPACDLSIAWTLFESDAREAFRQRLRFDDDTWCRARAWTLWKAMITVAGLIENNGDDIVAKSLRIIDEILDEKNR